MSLILWFFIGGVVLSLLGGIIWRFTHEETLGIIASAVGCLSIGVDLSLLFAYSIDVKRVGVY